MYKTSFDSEEEFKKCIRFYTKYFENKTDSLTDGLIAIKQRLEVIYRTVFDNVPLPYLQEGYSNLRPFEDTFQDAADFLETSEGKKVIDIFYYFAHNYQIKKN